MIFPVFRWLQSFRGRRAGVPLLLWLVAWSAPGMAAADSSPAIVVLGDSLSAGYGLNPGEAWVALLERRIADNGYPHRVVNASISGDTTRGGLARLPLYLKRVGPRVLVIELGGNDGLRGIPPAETENNLARMIAIAHAAGVRVLLVGMRLPPNLGADYTTRFERIFVDLANRYAIARVPFLLAGVATKAGMMQADGLHPTAAAQGRLLDNVWPRLAPLLD